MNSLPSVSLPKYDLELPCSKKKIKFRPFVVREEKLLLLAIQEEDTVKISTAVKEVLKACTFGLNIDEISQLDAEYLFLQIRNKSMGEGIDAISTCIHCEKKNYMTLDLSKVTITPPEKELSNVIEVDQNMWVTMRLPNIDDSYTMSSMSSSSDITRVIANCVVNIIHGDRIIDPQNHGIDKMCVWLEELTDQSFVKITDFLSNVPTMKFEQVYNCTHCGEKNLILLEGLESFFD